MDRLRVINQNMGMMLFSGILEVKRSYGINKSGGKLVYRSVLLQRDRNLPVGVVGFVTLNHNKRYY